MFRWTTIPRTFYQISKTKYVCWSLLAKKISRVYIYIKFRLTHRRKIEISFLVDQELMLVEVPLLMTGNNGFGTWSLLTRNNSLGQSPNIFHARNKYLELGRILQAFHHWQELTVLPMQNVARRITGLLHSIGNLNII